MNAMTHLAKIVIVVNFICIVSLICLCLNIEYQDAQKNDKNIVQRSNNGYNIIVIDPYDANTDDINKLFDDYNVMLFRHEGRLILEAWE